MFLSKGYKKKKERKKEREKREKKREKKKAVVPKINNSLKPTCFMYNGENIYYTTAF